MDEGPRPVPAALPRPAGGPARAHPNKSAPPGGGAKIQYCNAAEHFYFITDTPLFPTLKSIVDIFVKLDKFVEQVYILLTFIRSGGIL